MSITGHQTLEEVERYTREAQRRKLADAAMAKLGRHAEAGSNPERTLSHRENKRDNSRKKTKEIKRDVRTWRAIQNKTANSYIIEISI